MLFVCFLLVRSFGMHWTSSRNLGGTFLTCLIPYLHRALGASIDVYPFSSAAGYPMPNFVGLTTSTILPTDFKQDIAAYMAGETWLCSAGRVDGEGGGERWSVGLLQG